jgi:hypothetical protein
MTFSGDKSNPNIWATSVIVKKLPRENNQPKGENLPNLVTLIETETMSGGGGGGGGISPDT